MQVKAFYDRTTSTLTYVVYDEVSRDAIIIDPVLGYDPASGRTDEEPVAVVASFVQSQGLQVHFLLETHAHADHLSGSQQLRRRFPDAVLAIGRGITAVQKLFAPVYEMSPGFATDGSQFDRLLDDGEALRAGTLTVRVLATPGHTPACVSYLIGDAVFTGDALFMPDYGTGRCDFPGGGAATLYDSIRKLYALPDTTRVYTGHDYMPGGREMRCESTIGDEKAQNVHLKAETTKLDFVRRREERDATLATPKLLHPSMQVNIDAGHLPGTFLKIPLNWRP